MESGKSGNRQYTNGEITVFWVPSKCIHAARCVAGLPGVFNPQRSPWVDMAAASTAEIKAVVDTCPSGALTYKDNE